MKPIKEKKIGDRFLYRGALLEVRKQTYKHSLCTACYFCYNKKWQFNQNGCRKHHKCFRLDRKDRENVIFVNLNSKA